MEYYCLACRAGSEEANIRTLKGIVKANFKEDGFFEAYSPVRTVKEFCKKKFKIVNQPILPGYIIISTDYNIPLIKYEIHTMSASSNGLIANTDKSYDLRGSDRAYAEWITTFNGVITNSKVKVEKNLTEGTKITVLSGPMKELHGKIIRLYKNTRVLVEIPFLNEVRRINLPVEVVEEAIEE